MSFNTTTSAALASNYTSNLTSQYTGAATTNTRLVHTNVVAPSSVTLSTSSSLNSTSFNASSGSLTSASPTISGSTEKNGAAAGLVAKPLSWKYGVALGAVVAGSFVLGSGI